MDAIHFVIRLSLARECITLRSGDRADDASEDTLALVRRELEDDGWNIHCQWQTLFELLPKTRYSVCFLLPYAKSAERNWSHMEL